MTNVTFLDNPRSKKNTLEGFTHGIFDIVVKNLCFEDKVILSLKEGNIRMSGVSRITFVR